MEFDVLPWRRRNITTHHTSVALRLMNDRDTSTSRTPQLCVFRGRASGDESRSQGPANPLVPPQLRVCKTHLERFFTVLSLQCRNLSLLRLNRFLSRSRSPLHDGVSAHIEQVVGVFFFFFFGKVQNHVLCFIQVYHVLSRSIWTSF